MIFLRPLTIKDINRIFEIKSNPFNFNKEYTNFDTTKVTLDCIEKFILNIVYEINAIRMAICLQNNYLIGCITLGEMDYVNSSCELHIYIDIKYQNKGYCKDSLDCVIKYIRDIIKLKLIILKVHKEHNKAIHIYKKFGFLKNDKIINNFIYMYKDIQTLQNNI